MINSGDLVIRHTKRFLQTFGYLPQSDMETGALRTEAELQKAIRSMQRYAHIPVTGLLDEQTLVMMTSPRCGVPDRLDDYRIRRSQRRMRHRRMRHRRYSISTSKWQKRDLTWRVLNYSPDMTVGETRRALYKAFRVWSDVSLLTFRELAQGEADIMIRFATGYHQDGYPFDGPGLVLAHAFFPGDTRGGDVHFDDNETWTGPIADPSIPRGVNLFAVAAHEIGHALGLRHSSVVGSLMYPWYQGHTSTFNLHSDDIAGITYLYGSKQYPSLPAVPSPTSSDGGEKTRSKTTLSTKEPTFKPQTSPPTTTTKAATTLQPRPSIQTLSTPSPGSTTPTKELKPDLCKLEKYDAVAMIHSEIFMFSGSWFWRKKGNVTVGPIHIHEFWYGFPKDLDKIDAVYTQPDNKKILFFKGNRYWVYNANHPVAKFPKQGRPITEFGLPYDIKKVDAVFVWRHNMKTYFVTGDMYWRYNEQNAYMEYGYPRDISMWKGVETPVDTAFTYTDGKTYFFRGKQYVEFNNAIMEIRKGYPQSSGPRWFGCKVTNHETDDVEHTNYDSRKKIHSKACHTESTLNLSYILVLFICTFILNLL